MSAARTVLLAFNFPVALFCVILTFTGLFGLAAPEPNPWRWSAIASPLLLALWLSSAKAIRDSMPILALVLVAIPPIALTALLVYALGFAS
ncbi:MAG: hypothetical protein J7500_03910 [Sphingomonas sp.]|uniref:hypothetical protein n=1 Tax=Sphingomonas sp. TaxID=28214 RepID=UPI001B1CFD51|nr:hypothetical protein [Sphingomonas sp.]MBO9621837.1 hypothetical protein [Sphingomonas sp.]